MPLLEVPRQSGGMARSRTQGRLSQDCQPFLTAQSWQNARQSPECEGELRIFPGADPAAIGILLDEPVWAGAFQTPGILLAAASREGMTLRERLQDGSVSAVDWSAEDGGRSRPDEDEIEVDYTYISRACEAAAHAPGATVTDEDRAAYAGLGQHTYSLDIDYED